MTDSNPLPEALAPEQLEEIEGGFLQRMAEKAPIADLVSMARMVADAGEAERAGLMLGMLDEELTARNRWADRLELLERGGDLLAGEAVHDLILATLRSRWSDSPSLEGLIEKVGLTRATGDIPKTWQKVEKLEGLLRVDVGTAVFVEGKGAARVVEANLQLEKLKVRFESGLELGIGFGGASKVLQPLPEGHVLRRRIEEPEELSRLAEEDPGELMRIALTSYDEARTGAELKRDLLGPVPEKKWSSWWTSVRKLPQLVAASGRKNAWEWAGSDEAVLDAVREAFDAAGPREKLELLRRNSDRDEALLSWMDDRLAREAAGVAGSDPALACEIWLGMERLGRRPPEDVSWSPARLLEEHGLFALAGGVEDRVRRERLCEIAVEQPDQGKELSRWLLQGESELRAIESIAETVARTHPEVLEDLIDRVLQKPASAPALFVWVAERAGVDAEMRSRQAARLLPQVLFALGDGRFGPWKTPRIEPLFEAGGTVAKLLAEVGEDQAGAAQSALERSAALASHLKTPLLNALTMRFPQLRKEEVVGPLYATPEAIERKREEMRKLQEEEIPANRRAIEEARELGDLRENFEYKSARQRHEYLAARAGALHEELSRARPIDFDRVSGEEVVIGARVTLARDGAERVLTLLGPWDSDPDRDVLSNESDLARSLLGSRIGDRVAFDGSDWTVAAIAAAR